MDDPVLRRHQLNADISEADRLLSLTDNFRITALLTTFRGQALSELGRLPQIPQAKTETQTEETEIHFQSIDKWAWEQDLTSIKIYVLSLPDLRDVPNENLQLTSTHDSVDFKILNINGVNYRLYFKELAKTIGKVTFKTRKNGFVLKMEKSPCEPWNEVTFKPTDRIKSRSDHQDPMTKARNIILDEYDKGDDRTRKLIGEAMTSSRTGQKIKPEDVKSEDAEAD